MNTLNLDILINMLNDTLAKDVNQIFSNLLNEIQNYLDLVPISPNIIIIITDELKEYSKKFFSLGVRRTLINNQTQIEISEKYLKFLHFILLREAYLNFVPYELREKQIIQIVIHEIIESDLFKLGVISEWKELVRSNIINYDFLSSQFDKLDKFFKLEATETTQSPTQFFFEFIRRNVSVIHDKMDDFYDILYEEFIYKTSKSLYNDAIVETIRVLVKIFYQVKFFKNYSEFEDHFIELKEKGIISTNLSKRKFSENLRLINKYTIISPSYKLNYHKVNIVVAITVLKFNPILDRKDIYYFLDRIPFLHNPIFTKNGFSEEIYCYFVIPKIYLKDLLKFIEKLKNFGYIINKECYIWKAYNNNLNLNYFREYFKALNKIINPNHVEYDDRFELKFLDLYDEPHKLIDLNLLEWVIFERVAQSSPTGMGFGRRADILQSLKDEMLNYIESERVLIINLRDSLSVFYKKPQLKKELLDFLDSNQKFGFFYINDMLQQIFKYLDAIKKLIKRNPEIKTISKLQEFLRFHQFSQLMEENISFKNKDIQSIVFRDFIPLFFKSFQEFRKLEEKYGFIYNFFEACRKLKIYSFDLMRRIIRDEQLVKKIYYTKEKKLKGSFEKFKPYKITNQMLNSTFIKFLDANLISPQLINTITTSSFAKYHPVLLLKDTINVNNQIAKIIKYFPRVFLEKVRNLFTNESFIVLFTYFLNIKEKDLFCSILYRIFKENIVSFKRYFTSVLSPFVLIKVFFDFDRNKFFFTKDLFEESLLYIQKILGDPLNPLQDIKTTNQERFWSKDQNIINLVKAVDSRVSHEQPDFNFNRLNKLIEFNRSLKTILLNPEKFKNCQRANFFKNFIKSIKFIPNFQAFGLNQYFLYIRPSNIDEIDFKHLLINTFQSIKYPTVIDDTNSFLIKYIFPYRNPNMKHLNWYLKTKLIIQEYCLFSFKKIIQIFNFNYNLNANGWNYDSNRFKIYMQNILFNPDYELDFSKIRQLNMIDPSKQNSIGSNSIFFKLLFEIYTWKAVDIKSILGTRKYSIINNITTLIAKNLIFPYISLKNLEFQDKIYIILPNVKEELNQTIIKIFNFFNYGFIYEIEGDYYIHGFAEQIRFENGLMIKIYFPQSEVDEFLKVFDLLFHYLEINNYIILTDLTSSKNFLNWIFGDLSFLDSYNPLINLKWSSKDKIWLNHKLYTEKFEKIYPDLFYGEKKYHSL